MRRVSLRRGLLLLAAVAILPLALMSGVALQALLEQQRVQTEQSSLDLTRALATAVDTELRLTISALQTLASAEPLNGDDASDVEAAYRLSQRVVASRPEWRAVLLIDPAGKPVFSTQRPLDSPPATVTEPESLEEVLRTRTPVVGSLAFGPERNSGVPVRVPVLREGRLRFVLTAVVKPEAILEVVNRQRVPPDWIVSIFDSKDIRVARSRDQEGSIGTRASPSLQPLLDRKVDEVVGPTATLEGEKVLSAVTRLRSARWTVAVGIPTSIADGAWRHSALAYGGGLLLSLGVGALAAFVVARDIARPIGRLRDAATAMGRGLPPQPQEAGLLEVDAVSDALVESARLRERSEAERESLLAAEREARAAAERANRRLELLAGAGSLLSRSLEERTTLETIASVIVPGIADICRIDLLDSEGVLQRKLTHHADPQRSRSIAEFVSRGRVSPDTPGSFPWAIATGQTYVANFDSPAGFDIADPTFRSFAETIGMRAACVVPLVARGRTIGAMGALQTESGRKFSSEDAVLVGELAQRAALALDNVRLFGEAKAALEQAGIASRAKDDFLAMLGHELRNPLAPIVTSLELMARRDRSVDAPERRIIERQVAHLSHLVDDLLDVSRISSGKIHLRLERLDLRSVVHRALEMAHPALQKRERPPEVVLPADPAWVSGDPLRLAQVVSNLLVNAAKFSRPGDRIAVEVRRAGPWIELTVADEGAGIPPALLPLVFERFVQGEQALQRAAGGLGLGLAIARSLVELHGGAIRAESAGVGRGSRFFVTLPEAQDDAPVAPPTAARAAPPSRAARILIVDDNADAAESLAEVLRIENHEVVAAGSAEEALARLATFEFDIGILDIGLPGIDGYELARRLRADPRTRDAHLIALTGYGRAPDRKRALDAGFDEHMVKPVELETLLARLDTLLVRTAVLDT